MNEPLPALSNPPQDGGLHPPDRTATPSRTALVLWAALILVVFAAGTASLWLLRAELRREPLPVISTVPEFSLTNRDGGTVTRDDFAGAPWIADFIFTRCAAICPRMTWQLAQAADSLPPDVRLVSISVDPEHDTPEVLADYAARHGVGDDWFFLTGDVGVIDALTREAFLLPLDRSPPEPRGGPDPIVHSNRFVLVDGEARIRGYYDAFDDEAVARLLEDVETLVTDD